jgi:hypothetical protein
VIPHSFIGVFGRITRSATTASGRGSKVSYVASGFEDIDLK